MSFCLRRLLHFMFITAASPLRFVGLSRVRGAELFRRKGAVFVCNHGTLLDPMYALALIPDAGVLLKNKYGKILAIWYLVKCFDFIEIGWASASDASVRAELSHVLERSKRLLAEGKNYLIFPEGSRSKSANSRALRSSLRSSAAAMSWRCASSPTLRFFRKTKRGFCRRAWRRIPSRESAC